MNSLLFFIGTYLVIILFYVIYLGLYRRKKEYNKMGEVEFLEYRYKVKKSKINEKKLTWICVNTNAFIISITGTICFLIPLKFILQMIIGFIILFILIFTLYTLIGILIIKKGVVDKK